MGNRVGRMRYTAEHIEFLKDNIKGCPHIELMELFNKHFRLDLSLRQISRICSRHGLKNELFHIYTPEQIEFLKYNINGHSYRALAELFNKHFDLDIDSEQIREVCARNKIRNELWPHNYTSEQIDFLKENAVGRTRKELRKLFNSYFELDLSPAQMKYVCYKYKLKCRLIDDKRCRRCVPVGTERIRNGTIRVKVSEYPKMWRDKHLIIWEAAHGAVPKNHCVIFGDGNKRNFELDNLVLVPQRTLAMMTAKQLRGCSADLTKTGIIIADIHLKARDLSKTNHKPHQLGKKVPVVRLDDGKEYPSVSAAARDICGSAASIYRVCSGLADRHKGYRFKYSE